MIICLEDREAIDENAFVSNYENFKITINDGHIYLYKKVSFDFNSDNFTYMRIREHLGKTVLDFCVIGKDKLTFKDMIDVYYGEECTHYDIYKVSKIDFTNLDVTYSY